MESEGEGGDEEEVGRVESRGIVSDVSQVR